ncbi:ankyrin-1-like [Microplitis mediator]|uniref:ankyrin-1-like n=1 Tax=Microplitis mediator TaxID=375433 RepID=UPI0025522C70|nr:ankyrin-1-like [Microplitis mediator]
MSRLRYKYNYVLRLIERGAVENISTDLHSTSKLPLLHLAAWNGDEKLVTYLLQNGADINVNHLKKGTPLHIAVAMENLEIIKILVQFKADIHRQLLRSPWHTPLHRSVFQDNTKIVEYLLNNGGNVNIKLDDTTPYYCEKTLLHVAVRHSHEEMVKLLLEYNANVDVYVSGNTKHLGIATYMGNVAIMKLLIAYGSDVNGGKGPDGDLEYPPLLAAASRKNLEVLELLLDNDMVQINRVSKTKYSALPVEKIL